MNRTVHKYRMYHDKKQTLNGAISHFQRYMKREYGNKKYTVLLDAYLKPTAESEVEKNTYLVLFEFQKAKGDSNVSRVKERRN